MDSKEIYITKLSKHISNIYKLDNVELEEKIRKFMLDNYYMLCREISTFNESEETKKPTSKTVDMYCIEFNGHIYFADKRNRIYTANKNNPIEIGYIQDTETSRILVKYEGYENY